MGISININISCKKAVCFYWKTTHDAQPKFASTYKGFFHRTNAAPLPMKQEISTLL